MILVVSAISRSLGRARSARALGLAVLSIALPCVAEPISVFLGETPLDVKVRVTESLGPSGGTVLFDRTDQPGDHEVGEFVQAELLHRSDLGGNGSGRSTNISQAFGSAAADSNGEGGAGVSMATERGLGEVVHRMTAEAHFEQSLTNGAKGDLNLGVELNIPGIEVGLLGVAPFRSAPRATETAEAKVELATDIHRADGTFESGPFFQFGMRMTEKQIELAPNTFANFDDVKFLFENVGTLSLTPNNNDSKTSPRVSLDPITLTPTLGTLHPGDSLTFVYSLFAIETTGGGEGKGAFAFVGDPFDLTVPGGGFSVVVLDDLPPPPPVGGVPEPGTLAILGLGLGLGLALSGIASRRRQQLTVLE
jgi:hypothetical protein